MFNRFDLDGDGSVPLIEFRRYLSDPSVRGGLPDSVLDDILARADRNIDGVISYDEFLEMVNNAAGMMSSSD